MTKKQIKWILSSGYEVPIEKNDYSFLDHLICSIGGETITKYNLWKALDQKDLAKIDRFIGEECGYVVDTNIHNEILLRKAAKSFLTYFVKYRWLIVMLRITKLHNEIDKFTTSNSKNPDEVNKLLKWIKKFTKELI